MIDLLPGGAKTGLIKVKSFVMSDNVAFFTFVIPALILFGVFFIYPSVGSIYYSFTDWHGLDKNISFIGMQNYLEIFHDKALYASMKNTFILTGIVTVIQNTIGLILALALHRNIKTKNVLRTVFFLPSIFSTLAIGFVWSYIYNPIDGILNLFLSKAGLSFLTCDWLGDPRLALFSIIIIGLWQSSGYSMVIFLAGLDSIPDTYYEASQIDGAGPFQKFINITFPLIGPAITVNVLLAVIGCMKTFDIIYATTGGGPGYATETFASMLFTTAFKNGEYGYGTAVAVVLFLMILLISQVLGEFLRKREVET